MGGRVGRYDGTGRVWLGIPPLLPRGQGLGARSGAERHHLLDLRVKGDSGAVRFGVKPVRGGGEEQGGGERRVCCP